VNNPHTDRLNKLFSEYLGIGGYRSITDIPIGPRMLINELMLRNYLWEIVNSDYPPILNPHESTCKTVASRLTRDLIETIRERHC